MMVASYHMHLLHIVGDGDRLSSSLVLICAIVMPVDCGLDLHSHGAWTPGMELMAMAYRRGDDDGGVV